MESKKDQTEKILRLLTNVIDKITIYDDKATVKYKFKCDYLPGGSKYDKSNDLGFESVLEGGALCSTRVQSTYQPNRGPFFSLVRRRKIRMRQ